MDEVWKSIKGYEKDYAISNMGRLYSKKSDMIMKPMTATNGYLVACLWKNNHQKKHLIHRLVANAFLENPQNLREINHKDENKLNNLVTNLEWCTHKYNMNYGKIREKISKANKGKTAWNKGLKGGKKDV
jgi:hypothetical protein